MEEKIPTGDWVTVTEALTIIALTGKPVTRRRVQNMAADGAIRSAKVLGRLLLDRKQLIDWTKGPRAAGRPGEEVQKPLAKAAKKKKK